MPNNASCLIKTRLKYIGFPQLFQCLPEGMEPEVVQKLNVYALEAMDTEHHHVRKCVIREGHYLITGIAGYLRDIMKKDAAEYGDFCDKNSRRSYGFFAYVWDIDQAQQLPAAFPQISFFEELIRDEIEPFWEESDYSAASEAFYAGKQIPYHKAIEIDAPPQETEPDRWHFGGRNGDSVIHVHRSDDVLSAALLCAGKGERVSVCTDTDMKMVDVSKSAFCTWVIADKSSDSEAVHAKMQNVWTTEEQAGTKERITEEKQPNAKAGGEAIRQQDTKVRGEAIDRQDAGAHSKEEKQRSMQAPRERKSSADSEKTTACRRTGMGVAAAAVLIAAVICVVLGILRKPVAAVCSAAGVLAALLIVYLCMRNRKTHQEGDGRSEAGTQDVAPHQPEKKTCTENGEGAGRRSSGTGECTGGAGSGAVARQPVDAPDVKSAATVAEEDIWSLSDSPAASSGSASGHSTAARTKEKPTEKTAEQRESKKKPQKETRDDVFSL